MKKKIIVWILSMVMIIGFFQCSLTYAEGVSDYDFKCQLLSMINFTDYVDETTAKTLRITRGEFAKSIASVFGVTETEDDRSYYVDVPADHWGAAAINYLAERKIISVGDDKMFRPSDEITGYEALKVLIEAAGYGSYAYEIGGYPLGYIQVATELRINENYYCNEFTFDKFVGLAYEVLTAPMYEINRVENGYGMYGTSLKTLLSAYFNMHKGRGIVTATDYLSVKGREANPGNGVIIDDIYYKTNIEFFNSLGRYVNFIYRQEDEMSIPEIVLLSSNYKDEATFEIDSEDYIGYTSSTKEISYYDKNDKKRTFKLPDGVIVVKNGKVEDENTYVVLNSVNKGTIRFVDGNKDGNYEYVFIFDYKNYVVGSIDTKSCIVFDKLEAKNNINLDAQARTVKIYDSAKVQTTFEAITLGAILTVYESDNMITVYITSSTSTVEIFKLEEDHRTVNLLAGKNEQDKQWYKVDKDYYEKYYKNKGIAVKPGTKANICLDSFGNIAYISEITGDGWQFAYLVKVAPPRSYIDCLKMLLFTEDGAYKVYDVAEKVKIDGTVVRGHKEILKALNKTLYHKVLSDGEDEVDGQLVRVKFDNDGRIAVIDTEKEVPEKEGVVSLHRSGKRAKLLYKYAPAHFGGKYIKNGDTVMFGVPHYSDMQNADESDYIIISENLNEHEVYVEAFKLNTDSGFEDVMVVYNPIEAISYKYDFYLVESIAKIWTGEDTRTILKTWSNGIEYELKGEEDFDFDGVGEGDLIQIKNNLRGDVSEVKILYDYSEKSPSDYIADNNVHTTGIYNDWGSVMWGYLKYNNEGVLGISYQNPNLYPDAPCDFVTTRTSEAIMIYENNSRGAKVYLGTEADLITADMLKENAKPYFYCTKSGTVKSVIVYK